MTGPEEDIRADLIGDPAGRKRPHVIVLGNEKGGTGKSTTAMHLIVVLARLGFAVGSIDLDARRGTLTAYMANRLRHRESSAGDLVLPHHQTVENADIPGRAEAQAAERQRLQAAFTALGPVDYVVIDTPGSDTHLSRLAHGVADILVTPLNDSLVDVDILARVDPVRREVSAPSPYTRMVWEQNNRRVLEGRPPIDWVVMRNRLSHIDAHNKREMTGLLTQLSKRIGFRLAAGFGERVIFRELFLQGLTLLDLPAAAGAGSGANPSHQAGRREIAGLLQAIGVLPQARQKPQTTARAEANA